MKFEIDDANDTWVFSHKFDFIHCRHLQFAVEEKKLFRQALNALQPGGWFEIKETAIPILCDDGTLTGTAWEQWGQEMLKGGQIIGKPFDNPYRYKAWMEEAGFTNVQEIMFPLPVNSWPKDPRMKQIGLWEMVNCLQGLQGFCLLLFTEVLGWSSEAVEDFLTQVRKDLQNRKIHSYMRVVCVIGQKPTA